jgi:hypothetical protein
MSAVRKKVLYFLKKKESYLKNINYMIMCNIIIQV